MSEEAIDTEKFRQLLISHREEIEALAQTHQQASETVELDQSRVGRLSRMDALQGQAMSQATQQRNELELKRIASALKRIELDEYGYCLECGELIAEKRLEIDPAAPLCIQCASKQED